MSKSKFYNKRSEASNQESMAMRSNGCYDPIKSIPNL